MSDKYQDFARQSSSQFPHCDPLVLHSPFQGCEYCNARPEWQALRIVWGIAFTGDSTGASISDPAQVQRSLDAINRWGGNLPQSDGTVGQPEIILLEDINSTIDGLISLRDALENASKLESITDE